MHVSTGRALFTKAVAKTFMHLILFYAHKHTSGALHEGTGRRSDQWQHYLYKKNLKNHFDFLHQALFTKALAADPTSGSTICNFASLLESDPARLEQARQMYQRALELEPGSVLESVL